LTFGIILGIVGGIASVIATALPLGMRWYSMFMYESKLIRHLYTETATDERNPINLKSKVSSYQPFKFKIGEYLCSIMLYVFTCGMCCCANRCRARRKRFIKY
jgi:hypothetical protein